MSNLVQDFLRAGGTPEQLTERYAIKVKRHGRYPNLLQFKYDQIESPMGEPIVQQCRGLILDENLNPIHWTQWDVIAWPFDKFFNHGEGHAAEIDWETARCLEKLDGSLIIMYFYRDEWHVATSGMPDASGEVNGCGFTFAELFWRVWDEKGYLRPTSRWDRHPAPYFTQVTYMFELMTQYNRVVVRHQESRIVAIGERDKHTGEEYTVGYASPTPFWPPDVASFPLQTIEDVTTTFSKMDPLVQEGYVVVDDDFNRVKVKHPGYVAIHHMRDGFGPRRILEVIRSGETPEFLSAFPEWAPAFNEVRAKYDALVEGLEGAYEYYKGIEVQKDFAIAIGGMPYSGALFSLRSGKTPSIRAYLADINLKGLADYLKIKEVAM